MAHRIQKQQEMKRYIKAVIFVQIIELYLMFPIRKWELLILDGIRTILMDIPDLLNTHKQK